MYNLLHFLHTRKIKAWRQRRQLSGIRGTQVPRERHRWEKDYTLIECEGLFDEYLEMGKLMTFKEMTDFKDTFYNI